MAQGPHAYYKLRITYIDPLDETKRNEHELMLSPSADLVNDVVKQHSAAIHSVGMIWTGQMGLQPQPDVFIQPRNITMVEILQNVLVADSGAVAQANGGQ